jgi:hypothetical protein
VNLTDIGADEQARQVCRALRCIMVAPRYSSKFLEPQALKKT